MNRLYWVRHGESVVNLTKQFSYRLVDLPLTPKGVLQAQQTAEWFLDKRITAIYCSPLMRAAETAGIIGQRIGLPVAPMEEFREVNVGDLEKRTPNAADWVFNMNVMKAWFRGDVKVAFPGGEDYLTLVERFRSGFQSIMDHHSEANLLVVGHGGSFALTLKDLCPQVDIDWLRKQEVENCSITEIRLECLDGRVQGELVSWARNDHLRGRAAEIVSGMPDGMEYGGE